MCNATVDTIRDNDPGLLLNPGLRSLFFCVGGSASVSAWNLCCLRAQKKHLFYRNTSI